MASRRKKPKQETIEPGTVYVRPSGESHEVLWRDGDRIRSVRRRGKAQAEAYAARKQAELDAGGSTPDEIPFGDTTQGLDPSAGNSWLELLWQAAQAVAANPGSESTNKAARTIGQLANSAQRYVPRSSIGEDEMDDEAWAKEVASGVSQKPELREKLLEEVAAEAGLEPEVKERFLRLVSPPEPTGERYSVDTDSAAAEKVLK